MCASGNLIQIAQVLKSNGTDGELVLSFRDYGPEDIRKDEPVFIEYDGLPVPFFVESLVRRGQNKALVHLTDIESGEDADEIAGSAVYMKAEALGEEEYEEGDFSFLAGWTLHDTASGKPVEVGTVTDFLDIPSNPCIEVETKNGAVIIPLHEDLITGLDEDAEVLCMDVPAGLL